MRTVRGILILAASLFCVSSVLAQPQRPDFSKLIEAMEKAGCVVHEESGVKVCKRDYTVDGKNVEAIQIFPDRDHAIGPANLYKYSLDFLKRKLAA